MQLLGTMRTQGAGNGSERMLCGQDQQTNDTGSESYLAYGKTMAYMEASTVSVCCGLATHVQ